MPSRGNAISAYIPAFSKGGKIYSANIQSGQVARANIAVSAVTAVKMRYKTFTSTLANSGVVYAFAHGLAAVPAFVFITQRGNAASLKAAATSAAGVGVASVSAATSTNIYVAGSKNRGFTAFILV